MSTSTIETPPVPVEAEPYHIHREPVRATWNFSLDQIRQDTQHFSLPEQEALIGLFRWCIDPLHPMRRDDAARRLECSPELLYQLFTGKYRNPDKTPKRPSADFLAKLARFMSQENKKFTAVGSEFVMTPTAQKIYTACDLARESHTPVILDGSSYIGKTWTLKHYAAHNNHGRTFLCELEAARGLGGMVRSLASACAVPDCVQNTAALIERIKLALSPETLLLMDEMHLLRHTYRLGSFFACVEVIRRIYDFQQCGMVLCWTNLADLKNARHDELMQVWRRGVHRVALPVMPTKGDLKAILEHNGLEFPDRKLEVTVGKGSAMVTDQPYEIIRQQAKNYGLKAVTERIRYARKLADKASDPVNWTHFVDAHLRIEKNAQAEGEWN